MKRKDVEESCDDFSLACISNLSRKFPRLDEDPNVNGSLERGLSLEQPWTSNAMVHSEAAIVDAHPTSNASEERALVLYDPTKIHFVKSPSPPEFSIVVKSNLIPGLRDYLSSWGYALEKSTDNRKSKREENDNEGSRDSLAVVPWVGFHSPIACEERVSAACHPFEAEIEMMDTDEPYVISSNEKDMEIGENAEAIGSFPPCQQQHYMMLYNVPQNNFSRMSW